MTNHTSGSSAITTRNITNYPWDHHYLAGNLVAQHCSGDYLAYAIKGTVIAKACVCGWQRELQNNVYTRAMTCSIRVLHEAVNWQFCCWKCILWCHCHMVRQKGVNETWKVWEKVSLVNVKYKRKLIKKKTVFIQMLRYAFLTTGSLKRHFHPLLSIPQAMSAVQYWNQFMYECCRTFLCKFGCISAPQKSSGMVRIIHLKSGDRGLVKNIRGMLRDLAFAHLTNRVVLAFTDQYGTLYVYEVTESTTEGTLKWVEGMATAWHLQCCNQVWFVG